MAEDNQQQDSLAGNPPTSISKTDRIVFLAHEAKTSAQGFLHGKSGREEPEPSEIFEDAAFNPQKTLRKDDLPKPSSRERFVQGARNFATGIKNPKAMSRNNYARHAAAKIANHPQDRTNGFDNELIDAHDDLILREQSPARVDPTATDAEQAQEEKRLDQARERVHKIEQKREDLKSGWLLGRQVLRAKVVRPMQSKPCRNDFPTLGQYLGHLSLWYSRSFTAHRIDDFEEPPFDIRELVLAFERFAAVSTPWQSLMTQLRDVYCWEDAKLTTQIMVGYWTLWYFQQLVTFVIGYVIYITVQNKVRPTSVAAVRDRIERSRDQSSKARAWGELVQKHGEKDWIEPLFDIVGPPLQMQTSDLTMFLERLQNFYRWERPQGTWLSLVLLVLMFLFVSLASAELFMRATSFAGGCIFFYSFPIATNYPKYRHVVNPFSWLFWGVPDSAELAIVQLQQKVVIRDNDRLAASEYELEGPQHVYDQTQLPKGARQPRTQLGPTTKDGQSPCSAALASIRASDVLRFKTVILPKHTPAHVCLTRTHLHIEPDTEPSSSYPYTALFEMRKVETSTDSNQTSSSADTNTFTRSTHIAKWLEKNADIQLLPDGLGFVFLKEESPTPLTSPKRQELSISQQNIPLGTQDNPILPQKVRVNSTKKIEFSLILNRTDRDKIFTVVLGWSGLQWQPLYSMNRQNRLGQRSKQGEGNHNLDDAIKKGLS